MVSRNVTRLACAAAVFALGTVAVAQTNGMRERFTFSAANASKSEWRCVVCPKGEDRLDLIVNHWTDEAERNRLVSVLKDNGPDKLAEALSVAPAVGYINWPGNADYTI